MKTPVQFVTLPTQKLVENPNNRRRISRENFNLLVEKLEKKRQYKPLLVIPMGDNEHYMVIAGNHRLKAYKQLGVEELWVSILEFELDDITGLWTVIRDGEPEMEKFQTKDDAILDWAINDNEEYAENDWDAFVNDMHGYNLDWSRYLMSEKPPRSVAKTLSDFLSKDIDDKANEPTGMPCTCPTCGDLHELRKQQDIQQ